MNQKQDEIMLVFNYIMMNSTIDPVEMIEVLSTMQETIKKALHEGQ